MPLLLHSLALAVFAQGTSEFVLAGLLPAIALDLGVTVGTAGLLTSAFAIGMVVGAPVMAAFGRRLAPRRTLSGLLIVFAVAHLVGASTDDFGVLLGTRIVAALANAGFLAVALSVVGAVTAPRRRARAVSVLLGGTTIALVVGVPAGAVLGSAWGWRSVFSIIAALVVPALIAVLAATPGRIDGAAPTAPLRDELSVLNHRPLRRWIAMAVAVNGATFAVFTYLAPLAEAVLGSGPAVVPTLLAGFGVGASPTGTGAGCS